MQTHQVGQFFFSCDTPGCNCRYTAGPLATQQDTIALSALDGWLHVGASHYCPAHAKAGVNFPMANFPLAPLPPVMRFPADGQPVLETPDTLGTENHDGLDTHLTTPVQPGAGEQISSPADEAEQPPKADDAIEPLATGSHEGPEASAQSG